MGLYRELHRDFALRTKSNLEFVEKAYLDGTPGVYNVTQLINSCLGMVVFLKEGRHIPQIPTQQFCPDLNIEHIIGNERAIRNLPEFIRKFRNAIAHCQIEAYGEPDDIQGFELWNHPPESHRITWKVRIDTASIRALALALVKFVVENAPPQPEQPEG